MDYRTEHDSMGEVRVPADKYYGAQTERSRQNFKAGVGHEEMPCEIIRAFGIIKRASAEVNRILVPDKMSADACEAICRASDEVAGGLLSEHFPLVVFQTGSGTQTNMNVNEVIANRGNEIAGKKLLHPNDDVNRSQSSNDTFPSAMHVAAALSVKERLLPAAKQLVSTLLRLEKENEGIIKCGRTHLMDATPLSFSQEISGWRASVETDIAMIESTLSPVMELALGGTAVGTGLNAPRGFDEAVAKRISELTNVPFSTAKNKFHALTSRDELVVSHGAIKALAADLWKIANDVRFLSSGPRTGLGEIEIPENEPGSSIMPGKVNPTQCEAVTMVALQVMGNDTAVSMAASQGNFELNVFLPLIAYNYLQSVRLLSDVIESFDAHCLSGLRAKKARMEEYLDKTLMLVTALSPVIGYERAAEVAHLAHRESLTLKEACLRLGILGEREFDALVDPRRMIGKDC